MASAGSAVTRRVRARSTLRAISVPLECLEHLATKLGGVEHALARGEDGHVARRAAHHQARLLRRSRDLASIEAATELDEVASL